MFGGRKECQLDGCNRAASAICFCCNKNVCTRHFTEHIDAVKAQIDPLANEINTMVEKIQGLTIEQITEPSFAELQQWRSDMHELIDEIFSAKKKEMEDVIETNKNKFVEYKKQQSETIIKIQDDVKQLVEDGDATFDQIQLLKNQLATVETSLTSFGKDFLSVNTTAFDQRLITVSSKLNYSNPIFAQPVLNPRAGRKASVHSNLITPPEPTSVFSFGTHGSGYQQNPTASASFTSTNIFGGTSMITPSSFGSTPPSFGFGSNNNQSPFGNSPTFAFGGSSQK